MHCCSNSGLLANLYGLLTLNPALALICLSMISVFSLAEELFLRSWKAYESQFGDTDLMVVKPLQNLALFYAHTERCVRTIYEPTSVTFLYFYLVWRNLLLSMKRCMRF